MHKLTDLRVLAWVAVVLLLLYELSMLRYEYGTVATFYNVMVVILVLLGFLLVTKIKDRLADNEHDKGEIDFTPIIMVIKQQKEKEKEDGRQEPETNNSSD